jgi:hypothetical protein
MRNRVILTDDDDDAPAGYDLVSGSGVEAVVVAAPELTVRVHGHHCDSFEPKACARPLDVEPCRFVFPLSDDVRTGSVPPGEAGFESAPALPEPSRVFPPALTVFSVPVAPHREWQHEVITIDDDIAVAVATTNDDAPIPPGVEPTSSAVTLNVFQYAARYGHFPSVSSPSSTVLTAAGGVVSPHSSVSGPSATALTASAGVVSPHSTYRRNFEDVEAMHGDTTSSGSSGSSGSELSGDFVDHAETAFRRKDRKILEQFFPITAKRLRMAHVAPNLVESRHHRKQRVALGSDV